MCPSVDPGRKDLRLSLGYWGILCRLIVSPTSLSMMNQRSLMPALLALSLGACMPPSWGAGALLHPGKTVATDRSSRPHETIWFSGSGVRLKGWWFKAAEPRRGTIVYLHGVADNRGSSSSIVDHFVPRGFDVVAYDSRAHGESEGDACTYGYYEKVDLSRVLDGSQVPAQFCC